MKTVLAVLLFAVSASAQSTVNFEWDPHSEASVITGFHLYQSKQSGSYGATAAATFQGGTLTTGSIPALSPGRYWFVLRAYVDDPAGVIESENSNEVSLVVKPHAPRLVSAVQAVAMVPVRAVTKVAGLFQKEKGLRVK